MTFLSVVRLYYFFIKSLGREYQLREEQTMTLLNAGSYGVSVAQSLSLSERKLSSSVKWLRWRSFPWRRYWSGRHPNSCAASCQIRPGGLLFPLSNADRPSAAGRCDGRR
jgi:hypothetical protein